VVVVDGGGMVDVVVGAAAVVVVVEGATVEVVVAGAPVVVVDATWLVVVVAVGPVDVVVVAGEAIVVVVDAAGAVVVVTSDAAVVVVVVWGAPVDVVVLAGAAVEVVVGSATVTVVGGGCAQTRVAPTAQTSRPPLLQALMTAFVQGFLNLFSKPGANRPAWVIQAETAPLHSCLHSPFDALAVVGALVMLGAGGAVQTRVSPSVHTPTSPFWQALITVCLQVLRKLLAKPGANSSAWLSQVATAAPHAFWHSRFDAAQPGDVKRTRKAATVPSSATR
jgi:hypothetical protein